MQTLRMSHVCLFCYICIYCQLKLTHLDMSILCGSRKLKVYEIHRISLKLRLARSFCILLFFVETKNVVRAHMDVLDFIDINMQQGDYSTI